MPVNSARSCGGRRPSSTWPPATPPRAPASVSDHRWRSRLAFRGVARWWLGRPGWRQDLHDAVAMARNSDPTTLAVVVTWTYGLAIRYGVLRADDSAVRAIEEAVQTAQGTSNDIALRLAEYAWVALLNRDAVADRHRGLELMVQARDIWLRKQCPTWSRSPSCGRPGEGQARRSRCCHCGDAQSRDELHQAGRPGMAFGAPAFWWRRCWSVAPRATWPKPKRRSTGWRTCGPTTVRRCPRSRCCGCARC